MGCPGRLMGFGKGRATPPHRQRMQKKGRNRDKKTVIQSIALREEQHFRRDLREGREEWGTRTKEGTQ